MKHHRAILLIVLAFGLVGLLSGCNSDETAASQGEGVVSGYIVDGTTNVRLQGVTVEATTEDGSTSSTTSDAEGKYTLKFTVDSTSVVEMLLRKTGYRDSSFAAPIRSGKTTTQNLTLVPVSVVVPGGGGGGGTGLAQTIYFIGASDPEVRVYGVGGKETTVLSWEVRDSLGLPIDFLHAVDLRFSILGGINGGEYVSPVVMRTNASGQAHITFNAGIKSGVVQVVAEVVGRPISSGPVRVIITGGFPDQAHFTIATDRFNFPALGVANLRNKISVLIGDKYSNPASPSAVYFRSSAGVVQGGVEGVVTSKDGQGTVDLISGNPAPLGQYAAQDWGDGYHRVVARTLGQGGVSVQDSILLLWSGAGFVSDVQPMTFNIPNGGSQAISFRVSDALGHPLAAGTRILVSATIPPPPTEGVKQNQVFLTFGNSGVVELPDVIQPGPGRTEFTLTIRDGSWDVIDAVGTPVNLQIAVTGPNTPNQISVSTGGVVH